MQDHLATRTLLALALATVVAVACVVGAVAWRWFAAFPKASTEVIELTEEKRRILLKLRAEHKFQPHDFPPLGYMGAANQEDEAIGTAAVDGVIDAVVARPDGPLRAGAVLFSISKGMRKVGGLETEDRDRADDYMIEIWYLLGFKEATGRFRHGSAMTIPDGYGEPLPPGWDSPTRPRPIG